MSASVKTAISMQQGLFDDVNTLANELNISRSKLFVLAMEDFIKKNQNKRMLSQINAAFADFPDDAEKENTKFMQRKQKKMLQRDPW